MQELLTVLQEIGTNFTKVVQLSDNAESELNFLNNEYTSKENYKVYNTELQKFKTAVNNLLQLVDEENKLTTRYKKLIREQFESYAKELSEVFEVTKAGYRLTLENFPEQSSAFQKTYKKFFSNKKQYFGKVQEVTETLTKLLTSLQSLEVLFTVANSELATPNLKTLSEDNYNSFFSGKTLLYDKADNTTTVYYFFHENLLYNVKFVYTKSNIKRTATLSFGVHNNSTLFSTYENFLFNYSDIKQESSYSYRDVKHSDSVNFWKVLVNIIKHYAKKSKVKYFFYSGAPDSRISSSSKVRRQRLSKELSAFYYFFKHKLTEQLQSLNYVDFLEKLNQKVQEKKSDLSGSNVFKGSNLQSVLSVVSSFVENVNFLSENLKEKDRVEVCQNAVKLFKKQNFEVFFKKLETLKSSINSKNSEVLYKELVTFLKMYNELNVEENLVQNVKNINTWLESWLKSGALGSSKSKNEKEKETYKKLYEFSIYTFNFKNQLGSVQLYDYSLELALLLRFEAEARKKGVSVEELYKLAFFTTTEVFSDSKFGPSYDLEAHSLEKDYLEDLLSEIIPRGVVPPNLRKITTALEKALLETVAKYPQYFVTVSDYEKKLPRVAKQLENHIMTYGRSLGGPLDSSVARSFLPFPKNFSRKTLLEFKESPGSLYNVTEEAKFSLFNKREKLYYLALKAYGFPPENISFTLGVQSSNIIFKLP